MTTETDAAADELKLPALKVSEPEIDPDDIWDPDKLDREAIATRLTTIIEDEQAPFVISLDGRWGTGKTFLLKRWQAQLDKDGYQAIYFNAWEDDFCDDPLLAIIGQLSEHFSEGKFKELASKIADIALGLLTKQLIGEAVKLGDLKPESLLRDYREQRKMKDEVKGQLTQLAAEVRKESGQPLIFIIDELDRCRPTFAIELLERVKHIFDVPNIFFVFGINRSELVKSLESVYGKIDAGVYLRRFFDMEFILPDADPAKFCKHLVRTYGLDSFFSDLSKNTGDGSHAKEFAQVSERLPVILGEMGLSLRDMDYCVRLVALASKELQYGHTIYPEVLAFLIAVKIAHSELYRRFVQGNARGAELVNYLNNTRASGGVKRLRAKDQVPGPLDQLEGTIYSIDDRGTVMRQLELLRLGTELTRPEYLADETAKLNVERDKARLDAIEEAIRSHHERTEKYDSDTPHWAELIDLYDSTLRR